MSFLLAEDFGLKKVGGRQPQVGIQGNISTPYYYRRGSIRAATITLGFRNARGEGGRGKFWNTTE